MIPGLRLSGEKRLLRNQDISSVQVWTRPEGEVGFDAS
jgi:hypothetical protein